MRATRSTGVASMLLACAVACGGRQPRLVPVCRANLFEIVLNPYENETIAWLDGVALRPDGSLIAVGGTSFKEPEYGYHSMFMSAATDRTGAMQWSGRNPAVSQQPPVFTQGAHGVLALPQGDVVIAGTIGDHVRVERRRATGEAIFALSYGDAARIEAASGIAAVSDGGFVVSATRRVGGTNQARLQRLGPNGEDLWNVSVGAATASTEAHCVAVLPDGRFAVAGLSAAADNGLVWLAILDTSGKTVAEQTYSPPTDVGAEAMVAVADGIVLVGDTLMAGGRNGFFLKTDFSAMQVAETTYGATGQGALRAIAAMDPSGTGGPGFILAGFTDSAAPVRQAWLGRTDPAGHLVWQKTLGAGNWSVANGVVPTTAQVPGGEGFVVAGWSFTRLAGTDNPAERNEPPKPNAWLIRIDAQETQVCDGMAACPKEQKLVCADGTACATATTTCVPASATCMSVTARVACPLSGDPDHP